MVYKGLEIMQMISKGQIEEKTRFDFKNKNFNGEVKYYNGTLYWIKFDKNWNEIGKRNLFEMFNIQSTMVADFEPLKDKTIKYDKTLENLQKETVWKQKVKDEIKELKEMKVDGEVFTTSVDFAILILQELIEEREEKE